MKFIIKLKDIIREIRVHQWLNNVYVFFPLLLSVHATYANLQILSLGFIALCLTSSIVYILNDIKDRDLDRKHAEKKNRPLAAGKVTVTEMLIVALVFAALILAIVVYLDSMSFIILIALIFGLNVLYTNWLKNVPFVELVLRGLLYVFRTVAGFALLSLPIPYFLVITVFFVTIFVLGLQRLVEMKKYGPQTRHVLGVYSARMIRQFLVLVLVGAVMSYFLTVAFITGPILYSTALFTFILMYMNELAVSEDKIERISESVIKMFLSNKVILVTFALMVIFIMVTSLR